VIRYYGDDYYNLFTFYDKSFSFIFFYIHYDGVQRCFDILSKYVLFNKIFIVVVIYHIMINGEHIIIIKRYFGTETLDRHCDAMHA